MSDSNNYQKEIHGQEKAEPQEQQTSGNEHFYDKTKLFHLYS